MLSIGASYGHVRVQQDNLKERIRRREGNAIEKVSFGRLASGISPLVKLLAGGRSGEIERKGRKKSTSRDGSGFFSVDDVEFGFWQCDGSGSSGLPKGSELLAKEKAQASQAANDEIDLEELMDDPELEKLHAERIAALKKEAEKREVLKRQGHGEYREITEGDFLGEVTGSEKVVCHFYHREFYRCKIMDKHLKALSPLHIDTKFIKLDAENAPFFVAKLAIKTLPCVVLFRNGIAFDRLVGFQDLGGKDDFTARALEHLLKRKGIIDDRKGEATGDDVADETDSGKSRSIRTSTIIDYDSD
ncbi:Thioredoxin domain-containing protein 9 like [Apostasia shenzhenica]|uniref:Thioredoxin domain-containing protein 9 like n=1 Tax=Apostasia shenzhenica TaxID=1088818 RepID=A0A2I0AVB8_9ASPA|nr:Thioredoxin domain-containing protein 9 like [Apostasia shenzhenica]